MTVKCIICDDEPLALDLMESYFSKTPGLELVARCNSALKALEVMENKKVDLIFLDIQMPELSGLEMSRVLQNGPLIIFTTAFEQYAIEGYKVDAVDYLLKPVSYEEFLASVHKAKKRLITTRKEQQETAGSFIMVKSEYRQIRIEFNNLLYIEGFKDYVKFYLEGQPKPVMSLMSMKSLEAKLPAQQFLRVHRSYIVNLDKISVMERGYIVFGKTFIPVSENVRDELSSLLNLQ